MWGIDSKRGYIVANVCSTPEEFADYLDSLDSKYFTACLDVGHCGLVGFDEANFIKALGTKRLKALHIHDNDFKDDLHTLPFMAKLNWDSITGALKEIKYEGDFTLEADGFFKNIPDDFLPVAYKFMHDTGRYLIKKCLW